MAATSDNRSELMFLGKECQHTACHLHDFLPFTCPACKDTFCQPHFLPSQHQCTAPLPPSMVDRIAPQCPLCNEVVPTSAGGPNEAVERHIMGGTCIGLEGGEARRKAELKRRKENGEVCFRRGCTKVLVVPMKCDSCKHLFCPTHRHASSHTCSANATPSGSAGGSRTGTPQPPSISSSAKGTNTSTMSRLLSKPSAASSSSSQQPKPQPTGPSSPAVPIAAQLDARAAAAAAALKRAGQDAKAPFVKSKVEKRANAEANSQLQALKVRHEKGLLSKAEEVKYAELVGSKESSRRKGEKGKGNKDCVIA